jgi:hypothetical protein
MKMNAVYVKILVPVDVFEGTVSTVDFVSRTFNRTSDMPITLRHNSPRPAPDLFG